ncbi:MAG: NADH-quinone oxidoreductase subunit N [Candidatus Aminicenantia bacterium]
MQSMLNELASISAELFLSFVIIVFLFADPFLKRKRIIHFLSLFSLTVAFVLLFVQPHSDSLFFDALKVDNFSIFFKAVCIISSFLVILLSEKFLEIEGFFLTEYYFFILLSTIGMMFMASAKDLISIFLSYEIMAISSYLLSGYLKKDNRSNEAGIKYLILGTLSTGIFVFGFSFVFGLTSSTSLTSIALSIKNFSGYPLAILAVLLIMSALFFKISAVPFHMWTPDVYEGAPTPVTAFLSAGPKAASIAIFLRLFLEGFPSFESKWKMVIGWVSFFTMTYGNITALTQKSLKRMLAYSSIAHAGYILIGFASGGEFGYWGVLFYTLSYVFMNISAFGLILFLRKTGGWGEDIDDFNGLAKRSLTLSAGVVIILMSLVGIPPTGGFIGKYLIFSSAIKEGYVALAIAGVLNSVLSLFYYFRLGQAIFMKEPPTDIEFKPNSMISLAIGFSIIILLILGILPYPFMELAKISLLK